MGRSILKNLVAGSVAMATFFAGAAPAAAQIAVFDPTNHAQNVLQAARALQQIDQQIKMLQNQAKHLQKLDYSSIDQISGALKKIDQLIGKAEGVAFEVQSVDAKFKSLFPGAAAQDADRAVRDAKMRWENAMSAFKHTMTVQAQVVENVRDDEALLKDLVQRSQGAEGSLQVSQAANQLLALAAKQQFQIQSLMAAQYRAEAMEQARRGQAESEARAATKRFLGEGRAYTPQ
ncbi:P-type conjugative transfer protein TrbJ [Allosphingosinicella vermicomposti]|uniref:P-type conjugative transfer protein TrbJ n=1 Tax=Allosphingosinicella vermicomposti TaxID=614671 RepID=UPI000D11022B|nr:P-type conjugative transfer protein TrbJ [Allosphingosinicella vermicomposti]